jgi:hypothetical protein
MLREILKECFMPVGVGGGIQTIEQISELLNVGADKVVIKSSAIRKTQLVSEAVRIFGAQCICIAVDIVNTANGYTVYDLDNSGITLAEFMRRMNDQGAGEFMVTAVERDGTMSGFHALEAGKHLSSGDLVRLAKKEYITIGVKEKMGNIIHKVSPGPIKRLVSKISEKIHLMSNQMTSWKMVPFKHFNMDFLSCSADLMFESSLVGFWFCIQRNRRQANLVKKSKQTSKNGIKHSSSFNYGGKQKKFWKNWRKWA